MNQEEFLAKKKKILEEIRELKIEESNLLQEVEIRKLEEEKKRIEGTNWILRTQLNQNIKCWKN